MKDTSFNAKCLDSASKFLVQIAELRYVKKQDVSDDLYALSCQPNLRARIFSACIVDGVRYHTLDREEYRKTQNSGVMVEGTHNGQYIDFYGRLKEIIEMTYNSDSRVKRTVVLFRCDWFDLEGKKSKMKIDKFSRSINIKHCWYKEDPYILATQATKVFYLQDTRNKGDWRVVQKFQHRQMWNIYEHDTDAINGATLAYQDDDCMELVVQDNDHEDGFYGTNRRNDEYSFDDTNRWNQDCYIIDASVVDELRTQRDADERSENEESNDEDETELQYFSDNECPSIPFGDRDIGDDE